jgi:hypothetical protein
MSRGPHREHCGVGGGAHCDTHDVTLAAPAADLQNGRALFAAGFVIDAPGLPGIAYLSLVGWNHRLSHTQLIGFPGGWGRLSQKSNQDENKLLCFERSQFIRTEHRTASITTDQRACGLFSRQRGAIFTTHTFCWDCNVPTEGRHEAQRQRSRS